MPCPTCSHTMQRLGCQLSECRGTFWCPRCGTLLIRQDPLPDLPDETAAAPDLVRRCREFEPTIVGVCADHMHKWHATGVAEAINLPENRPT